MLSYKFYGRSDYFAELTHRIDIAKPGDRIALATMGAEPWVPAVKKVLAGLSRAASKKARVNLMVDAYCFTAGKSMFMPGPLFWRQNLPSRLSRRFSQIFDCLQQIKHNDGQYVITNLPKNPRQAPFKGRSHIKFAVFNDYVFIGNCNLDSENQLDMMVGWQNSKTADWLFGLSEKAIKTGRIDLALGSKKDLTKDLDSSTKLLVDSGQPGQSIIFDTAAQLIDSAKDSIFMTCQYFPDQKILDHLLNAHKRGVKIKLIYNNPLKRDPVTALAHSANLLRYRYRLPKVFFEHQLPRSATYLHAKLLIIDQKTTIIGSHNFVYAGVKFGTAEMAIVNQDPSFAKQATTALKSHLPI